MQVAKRCWWKEAIVYQIYPRSFYDSNGDGIGDIQGIIQKLDYIKSLGVDVIWLNPIYESPCDDNGYDISDYRSILNEYGTMDDFDEMLSGIHTRGMKLIMDLVVNHTSDKHRWFEESRKSTNNPYRDFYFWRKPVNGKEPVKRWSFFDVDETAWKYDELTQEYYLHYFSHTQPDLNWDNLAVRKEIYAIMKFWLDKHIDGFRMDVISLISKDPSFPELPSSYKGNFVDYYAKGEKLHIYLNEMNREVISKYDVFTVGECPGVKKDDALDFVDEDRHELNMFFHFELMSLDQDPYDSMKTVNWSLDQFKNIFTQWDTIFRSKGWGSVFLGNHDFPRMTSRWGNDFLEYRDKSTKMLLTFLLTMRGTPFIYNGDELGMVNAKFSNIESYQDIQTLSYHERQRKKGESSCDILDKLRDSSRDNARTPFHWNGDKNAGFSSGVPWMDVASHFRDVNVEMQEKSINSPLNYFRRFVSFRQANLLVFVYGTYRAIEVSNSNVYAYVREFAESQLIVVLNFSERREMYTMPEEFTQSGKLFLEVTSAKGEEHHTNEKDDILFPYEGRVYRCIKNFSL